MNVWGNVLNHGKANGYIPDECLMPVDQKTGAAYLNNSKGYETYNSQPTTPTPYDGFSMQSSGNFSVGQPTDQTYYDTSSHPTSYDDYMTQPSDPSPYSGYTMQSSGSFSVGQPDASAYVPTVDYQLLPASLDSFMNR